MAFNIKSKQLADTTFVHLTDPITDEKLYDEDNAPVGIEIYGKASSQYRSALAALSRKQLARKGKAQSFETNVEDNVDILVAISKAAVNFDYEGEAINSPLVFKRLYSDATLFWIKDQIQNALEDNSAFTKA